MSKSEVSKKYAEEIREAHGWKTWPPPRPLSIAVTGTSRPGSIGAGIAMSLSVNCVQVTCTHWDVTEEIRPGTFDGYDAVIFSHGAQRMDWFEDAPMDAVENVFAVNLTGSYRAAQAFVRDTIGSPYRKKIIFIGSMAYKSVLNGSAAYCASKAGLSMLVKCMAWELAPKGYDVYIIHPSNVDGAPMARDTIDGLMRYRGISKEEAEAYWGDSYLRGRSLTIEEIAETVRFLLRGRSEFLSGTDIDLGGGQR